MQNSGISRANKTKIKKYVLWLFGYVQDSLTEKRFLTATEAYHAFLNTVRENAEKKNYKVVTALNLEDSNYKIDWRIGDTADNSSFYISPSMYALLKKEGAV